VDRRPSGHKRHSSTPLLPFQRNRGGSSRARLDADGGGLRWTLQSTHFGAGVDGSGTVSVTGDQVKLAGTYSRRAPARGQSIAVEYTARLEGETLQGAGVGADTVPQRFTLKRAGP
jgi:hypothetical protein